MKRNPSLTICLIISIILFIGLMVSMVQAATLQITTTQDNVEGSLRAAITTVNANNEDNTIYLPAGTYTLTGDPGEDSNAGGDLDINTSNKLTIIGDGIDITIIEGSQIDRVLHILNGTVIITGVTVQNGKTADGDYLQGGEDGGGIYNSGTIKLRECIIKNNITGNGWGAIFGPLGGKGGYGGGIFNNGIITLTNCTISSNETGKGNGSCIVANSGHGGGIYNSVNGKINLENCSIYDNLTGEGGYSPCAGPPSYGGDGGSGGAIYNEGTITLTNCTASNNSTGKGGETDGDPEGYGGSGGAICNSMGLAALKNCTITENSTGSSRNGHNSGDGGGIYNYYGSVYVKNTIIANNHVSPLDGEGPDFWGYLESGGYNLIEDISYCSIYEIIEGNIIGEDPLLGPLTDNGGPTQTHALLPGSPAIDAGDSSGSDEDQRGITRPIDIPDIANASDGADIGAYEFNTSYTISGTITYGETGLAGVTLTFSNSGGATFTNDNGYYSHQVLFGWSGTVTPSKKGYIFTPSSKSYTPVTSDQTNQNYTAAPTIPSQISLSRTQLNFGVVVTVSQTNPQTFLINNSGGGILYWTISDNASWLSSSPTSGTNSGEVTVSVDASGLSADTYNGTITVSAPNASISPQTVKVTLVVYNANTTGMPFGYFETPRDRAYVYSSIPVTGWALDDIEVENVKIYRKEGKELVYIGDAVFVDGARPDVEMAYPNYPKSYRAGWGYMMLTNFLPNGGNGTFTLHAIATDKEGNQVTLGTKTIECDNANAVKPFGAIDTPAQGGTTSGSNYRNQGWVLTPLPNKIPEDGHTINVWIDGVNVGNPIYNIYRSDIAALFPGYANSNGAMAYFDFDTTAYENGVHTIQWTAVDNAGNVDGIGSRYFTIQNTGGSAERKAAAFNVQRSMFNLNPSQVPLDYSSTIRVKKGYNQNIKPHKKFSGENGNITIEIKELERIEIHFSGGTRGLAPLSNFPGPPNNNRIGFLVVGDQLRKLPIGSFLDTEKGIFSWMPGPGFVGTYRFIFLEERQNRELRKTSITVNILPK